MNLPAHTEVLIVGAGPIGLSVAISARRRAIEPLVIDAGALVNSIAGYPPGMNFFTTSERLEIGGHPLSSTGTRPTREEALSYYRGVVRAEGIDVRPWVRLVGATRNGAGFEAALATRHGHTTIGCDRLVLATGYFDHPNLLDVPGESLPHVSHKFDEPHLCAGQDVVIMGGKNSAIEAALLAFRAGGRVTLVHRGDQLKSSVKYWLRPDFENRVKAGEIAARFGTTVLRITTRDVVTAGPDGQHSIPADRVYLLTGYHPDFELLRSLGVELDPVTGRALVGENLESSVPGLHLAGSVAAGRMISEVFIENGRYDGEKIFGGIEGVRHADRLYADSPRPVGE
ncbi:MAG TPA: YpdA family putative bacillithiol disulfide reductase [Gemmatimonadales bacterium]|nr:YpdA family putative bacillithiol disulfide reductase [Gemmatimonadales bacterium]